jgi:hypothetical protein
VIISEPHENLSRDPLSKIVRVGIEKKQALISLCPHAAMCFVRHLRAHRYMS